MGDDLKEKVSQAIQRWKRQLQEKQRYQQLNKTGYFANPTRKKKTFNAAGSLSRKKFLSSRKKPIKSDVLNTMKTGKKKAQIKRN